MQRFIPIFIVVTFLSLHLGAILYVNSSLLGNFFKPETVSFLFLLGALGNITLFLLSPKLIERFGKRLLLIFFLTLATITTIALGFAQTALTAFISFTVYSSIFFIIYYTLDIFLEELSMDTNTGEIRGLYFTFINLGIAVGPLVLATFAEDDAVEFVYIAAAFLLLPPILLAIFSLKSRLPKWHGLHPRHMFLPLQSWWQTKNVRHITLAKLILEFFFAFMVIYIPVYLHAQLGFSWSELGIMFTVMLLPFVFLQWPAGELADRLMGEKEIMSIGFLITAGSLVVMPFIGKVFVAWMIILFISRVGASFIQIMTESYFFKQVDASDIRLISIFRLARPVGIILAVTVGIVAFSLFSFEKLLFVAAVVVLFGLKESLSIEDTK